MIKQAQNFMVPTVVILLLVASCNGREANSESGPSGNSQEPKLPQATIVRLVSPEDNSKITVGNSLKVELSLTGSDAPDSVRVYLDGRVEEVIRDNSLTCSINTSGSKLGRTPLKIMAYRSGYRPQIITHFITIYSDITPVQYTYRIKNSYPHDIGAYTQGLVYDNGYFLEGTGKEGHSNLRKVDIESGEPIVQHNLDSKFFGEGIVRFRDRVFQLTWTSKVGFVYDAATFTPVSRIHYDTQGWGLTTDGEKLIMSDGTNKIYFLEPDYFTVLSTIEVFDDQEGVWQLNELEYINGELWANIYMTNQVARIDPGTGKVLGYIDFSRLLKPSEMPDDDDEVLNGIAWDSLGSRIFVTGKHWPKLFEVEVIRK